MKWNTVKESPLVIQDERHPNTYDVLIDDVIIVEIDIAMSGPAYYVGAIGESLQIEDGFGCDIGYSALDVSRWAFFQPPI